MMGSQGSGRIMGVALVVFSVLGLSEGALARDLKALARDSVVNLYGQPGDQVSVKAIIEPPRAQIPGEALPRRYEVTLTNGAEVGSVVYEVEILAGDEQSTVKVQLVGGN